MISAYFPQKLSFKVLLGPSAPLPRAASKLQGVQMVPSTKEEVKFVSTEVPPPCIQQSTLCHTTCIFPVILQDTREVILYPCSSEAPGKLTKAVFQARLLTMLP